MRYVTRDGVAVEVGRIDRRRLDEINIVEPAPPLRKVETWGGIFEEVPVYDDLQYARELHKWGVQLWREKLNTLSGALDFLPSQEMSANISALNAIGIGSGNESDFLRYGFSKHDQAQIVALIYYQSTVTARGISEAEQRLKYEWREKPLSAWSVGYSYGKRGALGVDMHVAFRSGLTWGQFCKLSGQEQSMLVAFWNLEERLSWLMSQQK